MENLSSYFYLLLFTLFFMFVGGVILYKWYFAQKYTRERFAFYSIWVFSAFLISLITLLLVRNQALDLLVAFSNQIGFKIEEYGQVDFYPTAGFILFCAGMMYFLIRSMHHNWNGVPSTRQVDLQETNRRVGLLEDAQFYWKNGNQIEVYQFKEKAKPEVFSPYEPDTRPWHIKAANLFSLLDQQYHINIEKDWYGEHDCFISRYGQDDERIGILCLNKRPSEERLHDFIDFVNTKPGKFNKLIIATEGKGPKSEGTRHGHNVQYRFEEELLKNLVPLNHYKDFIKDYFDGNTLENSDLKMSEMYVPLGGHTVNIEKGKLNKDQGLESVEAHILQWAKGKRTYQSEHLAILGDYGQGKTVLMHKIVHEMLAHPDEYPRIPILIELRGLSPRNDNEFSILGHWANRFKAKAEALWELHQAGKLLLILDGFDEMDLVGDTEMLFNHFTQLWALARVPNSQIIVAGRPNLFADDEQRRMALGIQNPRTDLPYAQAIYLDKLRNEQIERVLRHAKAETQAGILSALQNASENSSFAEIITRPSTLFQLSTVWDSELAKHQERLNSATVIGSFINKTYERQQRKGDTVLTAFERSYFMLGIAVGMMLENGYTNQIKHKDLQKLVERLWANYPPKLPPYTDAMQGNQAKDFLPTRMKENADALATILKDVRAGGILVQDLSGRDVFKFAHKSYLEYLVSAFFSGLILQNEHDRALLLMVNAIAKTHGFSNAKLKGSADVEVFTAELIAAQIEVKDENGDMLPVVGNEEKYGKKLFKMLIIRSYPWAGRLYPRTKIWLSLHDDIRYFLWIGSLAIVLFTGFFLIKESILRIIFLGLNSILCFVWAVLIMKYRLIKESLKYKRADYLSKFRLYLLSCQRLGCPDNKLPKKLRRIISGIDHFDILQELSFAVLAGFITVAGSGSGLVASAVAFAGFIAGSVAFAVAVAGLFAIAVAFLVVFVGASRVTTIKGKLTGSVAVAYAAIVTVAVIGVSTVTTEFAGAIPGAGVGLGMLLMGIRVIRRDCKVIMQTLMGA